LDVDQLDGDVSQIRGHLAILLEVMLVFKKQVPSPGQPYPFCHLLCSVSMSATALYWMNWMIGCPSYGSLHLDVSDHP
jgi:hypothetical protein